MTLDEAGELLPDGEQRYYPFGESRIDTAALPTDRLYTGQREIADFDIGLYHYNARFYSPSLGRFVSADTDVPARQGVPELNRYAFAYNNPLKYIDPTGHMAICAAACEAGTAVPTATGRVVTYSTPVVWQPSLSLFGVDTAGLTSLEQLAITAAVRDVGAQLAAITPGLDTPAEAFRETYGLSSDNRMVFARCPAGECTVLGLTNSSTSIWFNRFDNVYATNNIGTAWEKTVHLVVHELGHAFNGRMTNVFGAGQSPYTQLFTTQANNPAFPNREGAANVNFGFAGPRWNWQQSDDSSYKEEFADMFVGWTYNQWEANPDGTLAREGQLRADWMAARMPLWVNVADATVEDSR